VRKTLKRPPDAEVVLQAPPDGLSPSPAESTQEAHAEAAATTLGSLPVGARLVLRCRADWRTATVAAFDAERGRVVLNVASPSGHTYRVRRPYDSPLAHEGHVPLLGEGCWRAGLARYDVRW
jgi:hypothetical protein